MTSKPKSSEEYIEYVGIADTEGLDAWYLFDKCNPNTLQMMELRARFNPQRNAMLFKVIISKDDAKIIDEIRDSKLALLHLKKKAIWVGVPGKVEHYQRVWDSIPHYRYDEIHSPEIYHSLDTEEDPVQLELDL